MRDKTCVDMYRLSFYWGIQSDCYSSFLASAIFAFKRLNSAFNGSGASSTSLRIVPVVSFSILCCKWRFSGFLPNNSGKLSPRLVGFNL